MLYRSLLALGLFTSTCGASAPPPLSQFGLRLAAAVANHDGQGRINRMTSPLAEQLAFGMVANGAAGETRERLLKTLGYDGKIEGWNDVHRLCQLALTTDPAQNEKLATLTLSSAAWSNAADPANRFHHEFADRLARTYDAEIGELDFTAPPAADAVNAWAKLKSRAMIPKIMTADALRDLDYLLVNITYFAGGWANRFRVVTPDRDPRGLTSFTKAGGAEIRVDTITDTDEFRVLESPDHAVIELPIRSPHGREYVFFAALASDKLRAPAEFHANAFWMDTMARMRREEPRHGSVSLPKFAFDFEVEMREGSPILGAMDLDHLFEPTANFRALSPKGARVGVIKEITRIELDEKGVKAAGAVSVGFVAMGVGPRPAFNLKLNRPFAFAIAEKTSGNFLFLGELQDPSL